MTTRVSTLKAGTFLSGGSTRVTALKLGAYAEYPANVRISTLKLGVFANDYTNGVRVTTMPMGVWASLDQAFYALAPFGSGQVFTPDFDIEPIFESPEPPVIEVNPYRAAEPNTDLQQILREQHMVNQSGDSTFHWGVLTEIYNEPLYNLGSLGKFYHDDLGIIHARYCRFVDFNLTAAKAVPVGLRKPANLPWTVTNQLDLSAANAVLGIALPYDSKINIGTWYGWVITEGFVPAEVEVTASPKPYPFGTEYGWAANGKIEQELDSNSVGYRVKIGGTPSLTPGVFYVNTDTSSLGRANGLITARIQPLVDDIAGHETRLVALKTVVDGHTVEIGAINQRHTAFVTSMTAEIRNLSDALAAIRALMPDSNFKEYVDTSVANLKGYTDAQLTIVNSIANSALTKANQALSLIDSISYDAIQVQINALNNAMGGITDRIIGFKTTIDTNTLTAGQTLVSYLYDTDVDGVNYYDFRPVDFKLAELLDVDLVTVPPVDGDSLVWDATAGMWVPEALSGSGIPDAPSDGTSYVRNTGAWVPESGGGGGGGIFITSSLGWDFPVGTSQGATVGFMIQPEVDILIHEIYFKVTGSTGRTYKGAVAAVSGGNVITAVAITPTAWTCPDSTTRVGRVKFAGGTLITAGSRYFIGISRTDGATNAQANILAGNLGPTDMNIDGYTYNGYADLAQHTPAIGHTFTFTGADYRFAMGIIHSDP